MSGNSASTNLTQRRRLPVANKRIGGTASSSANTSRTGSPPAFTASSKQPYTKAHESEWTNALTGTPQKVFVLSYDAKNFEYDGSYSTILLPGNGTPVKTKDEPCGVLGLYRLKTRAKTVGKNWLYTQLRARVGLDMSLPFPVERDGEFNRQFEDPFPGTWRRSGDERSGWDYDSYLVTDLGRDTKDYEPVTLSVSIKKLTVDQCGDGEGYETDVEDGDGESVDGIETSDEDEIPKEGRAPAGIAGTQAPAAEERCD